MADTFPPTPPPSEPPGGGYPPSGGGYEPPPPPAIEPLPWEQPGAPPLEALFETAKLFVTDPTEAFRRMPLTSTLGRPLVYAVILGWVGVIIGQLYSLALSGTMRSFLPMGADNMGMSASFNIAMMIFGPIFVLLGVFISAAIVHLFLLLVGGANQGFIATTRVMCYATTTQIVQVVPICGGFIAFIWALVLEIIGISVAHRTTQGKAALAVLLPAVLCCVCIAVVVALFGAAIGGLLRGAN